MGTVVELRPRARQEFTGSLGMIIFLASWGMMFAGLFFVYGYARLKSVVWPPPGLPILPIGLPALNTAVMIASSLALTRAIGHIRRGERGGFQRMIAATLGLGVLFLGLQVVVWRSVAAAGLSVSHGLYGAVFYTFTAFHAARGALGPRPLAPGRVLGARLHQRAPLRDVLALRRHRVGAHVSHDLRAVSQESPEALE
jgi:heme/copper-type cytochrome/quinol oxidase subunit 3